MITNNYFVAFVWSIKTWQKLDKNGQIQFETKSRQLQTESTVSNVINCFITHPNKTEYLRTSLETMSIIIINSSGLSTDPWCNSFFTSKLSLLPSKVLTTVKAPSFIAITADTNHSSTLDYFKAQNVTSLSMLSKAFSMSINT